MTIVRLDRLEHHLKNIFTPLVIVVVNISCQFKFNVCTIIYYISTTTLGYLIEMMDIIANNMEFLGFCAGIEQQNS